jgi:hypothetical protein
MKLGLGLCYEVLLASGQVIRFRFVGTSGTGQVEVELPPGSNQVQDLMAILQKGYLAYWEVPCP